MKNALHSHHYKHIAGIATKFPDIIGINKTEVTNMGQQTFETTDYGEMTLAKIGPEGVEFLLKTVEKTVGKFGDFVVLTGVMNGEPYEIRAGGRAAKLFSAEEKKLIGKVVSIIPSGEGMNRKYLVKTIP
jgi:hypothetical protein